MPKRSKASYLADQTVGNFIVGELIPLKNCWLRVAHVEQGVLILALDGYTTRGIEILEQLKANVMARIAEENANTTANETVSPPDGGRTAEDNPSRAGDEAGSEPDPAATPDISKG